MKPYRMCLSFLAASVLPALLASPAFALTEDDLRALDQKCEQARTAALTPIRETMTRECAQLRPWQECETELSTYGNSRTGGRGNVVPGLFYDLPECKAAQAAWEEWDRTRPWK